MGWFNLVLAADWLIDLPAMEEGTELLYQVFAKLPDGQLCFADNQASEAGALFRLRFTASYAASLVGEGDRLPGFRGSVQPARQPVAANQRPDEAIWRNLARRDRKLDYLRIWASTPFGSHLFSPARATPWLRRHRLLPRGTALRHRGRPAPTVGLCARERSARLAGFCRQSLFQPAPALTGCSGGR